MAEKMSLEDFLGVDKLSSPSPNTVAFRAALDFEHEVTKKLNELGLSRKDLAKKMGISQPAVSKLLTKGTNLTLKSMAKVAVALGCCLSQIKLEDISNFSYLRTEKKQSNTLSVCFENVGIKTEKVNFSFPDKRKESVSIHENSDQNVNESLDSKLGDLAA